MELFNTCEWSPTAAASITQQMRLAEIGKIMEGMPT